MPNVSRWDVVARVLDDVEAHGYPRTRADLLHLYKLYAAITGRPPSRISGPPAALQAWQCADAPVTILYNTCAIGVGPRFIME